MEKEKGSRIVLRQSNIKRPGKKKGTRKTDRGQRKGKENPGVWMSNEERASDGRTNPLCQMLLRNEVGGGSVTGHWT